MFATLVSVALFAAAAIRGANAADLAITTPTLVQCQSAEVTWQNGDAPFSLAVVDPENPCDTIADLGDHQGSSMKWLVAQPAGTNVTMVLADINGAEAWTADMVVQPSNDTSCLSTAQIQSAAALSSAIATSSAVAGASTLVIAPSAGAAGNVESAPSADTSGAEPSATAVGDASSGKDPLSSGASALRPATAFVAVAAAFMLAL